MSVPMDALKTVLSELARTSAPSTDAVHAANQLRECIEPGLIPPVLPDPGRQTIGQAHRLAGDTERAAAQRIAPRAGTIRWLVLRALHEADYGGLTNCETAELLGRNLYSVAPRLTELALDGWVRDSGDRRPTPNGNPSIVWILTELGRELYEDALNEGRAR